MSNKDPDEICKNCIHFVQVEGQCRKNAPRGVAGFPWPNVRKTDWCSEFETNQNAKKPNCLEDVASGKES